MGRKKEVSFVDSATVAQAEADLRGLGEGKVAKRLLAIIAVGREKRLQEVADILRVTRQSVYRWIGRYRRQGLRGLYDRPKGHRRKRLSDPQEQEIQRWLVEGKDAGGGFQRWTVDKMKMAVEKQFGVGLSRTRLWVLMRAWGFRLRAPRPRPMRKRTPRRRQR